MKSLALVGAVLLTASVAAHAASLPERFKGLWVLAEVPNKDKCRKEEPKGEDDRPVDSMMSVEGGTISYYEMQCQVQSARELQAPGADDSTRINLDVRLTCKGEGQRWSAREIWHIETIDGKKVMAVTQLGQTDVRDERGRKQKSPNLIATSIYFACK
jgi:hypothetical protein